MENYFETRKNELNQEAQIRKDRFINDTLRLNQEFQQDWTNLNNKLIEVTKKEEEQDKINPR